MTRPDGVTTYQPPRYLRCGNCGVPQPAVSAGQSRCVSCGAPLQRWVAHAPPATGPAVGRRAARKPSPPPPYLGPPSYRGGHPRWSFPPVVWKDLPDPPVEPVRNPAPGLRRAAWLALVTAVAAGCAAGAEIWRFVLMLQGRTEVLSGTAVRSSDVLVAAMGLAVVVAAIATAVLAVPAVVRAHHAAAVRLGRARSRSTAAVALRLLVPIWNIYGAGQIVMEIDRMLTGHVSQHAQPNKASAREAAPDRAAPTTAPQATAQESTAQRATARQATAQQSTSQQDGAPPAHARPVRASRLTTVWWWGWILSSLLVVAALTRGWGDSLQAIADTVELHIAVDLVAVVVAVLTALMLRRFARLFDGPRRALAGWVVQPPAPTRPLPGRPATTRATPPTPDATPPTPDATVPDPAHA